MHSPLSERHIKGDDRDLGEWGLVLVHISKTSNHELLLIIHLSPSLWRGGLFGDNETSIPNDRKYLELSRR